MKSLRPNVFLSIFIFQILCVCTNEKREHESIFPTSDRLFGRREDARLEDPARRRNPAQRNKKSMVSGHANHFFPYQDFEHFFRVRIDLDDVLFDSGHVRNVVVASLSLLFLQFDRYSVHGAFLYAFHQVRDESTCNGSSFDVVSARVRHRVYPAILFRSRLLGMIAISSHIRLFVWKSSVSRV